MMTAEHKTFHGRKVRVPNPRPGWINPVAGKLGDVTWAGWDDWYLVHVDGVYFVRARAYEIEPNLVPETEKGG
jgi:hypothetical protein